ncbi:MAG: DUF1730 domain-containing protein [Oscillospiraceae bacterium]|jgi:epoxyqueuosine reductase QueG|nr:DUF1730 domain-containing protein [Oscillospiraceae bacterium]
MNSDVLRQILPDFEVCDFADIEPHLLPCKQAARLPEGARSVLVAVFPYLLPEKYYIGRNVARFAVVPDYHKVVIARLEKACALLRLAYPGHAFVSFADNSPVPEKTTAVLCGLGTIGRNALFIHPRWGSWVFLGAVVSTVDSTQLVHSQGAREEIQCVMHCKRCMQACPANAIAGGKVDKGKCLSFRSQSRDADREALARQSGVLWGCDICQEVCPTNAGVPAEPLPEFVAGASPVFSHAAEERVWAWRFGKKVDN